MKHVILSAAALAIAAISAGAQNFGDALTFSETNYQGTARSMALGNAVTALGGDLGTIGINPAGSAVCNYSQLTFSTGLNASTLGTSYAVNPTSSISNSASTRSSSGSIPNFGFVLNYELEDSPWTAMTFGFVLNTVNCYNSSWSIGGVNSSSSKFAEMASAANGISADKFTATGAYDDADLYQDVVMAYRTGLINSFGSNNQYVGCTEGLGAGDVQTGIPGALNQTVSVNKYGTRSDILFNVGFNCSNKFYWGFNMGIPVGKYTNRESIAETAQNNTLFPMTLTYDAGTASERVEQTYFQQAKYQYDYSATISGIYGKIGFIWLPTSSIRIGGAYQTRTVMEIEEHWQHSGLVRYANGEYVTGKSDKGSYIYDFYSPRSMSFGLAYTFGQYGLLSVDWEGTDYSTISFGAWTPSYDSDYGYDSRAYTYDFYDDDAYAVQNACMPCFAGWKYELRIGAEFNVLPQIALRAGWTRTTSPELYYVDNLSGDEVWYDDFYDNYEDYSLGALELPSESRYVSDVVGSWSIGAGWKSKGSMYADVACKFTTYPASSYRPYYDYSTYTYDGAKQSYVEAKSYEAPVISIDSRRLVSVIATLGWRF